MTRREAASCSVTVLVAALFRGSLTRFRYQVSESAGARLAKNRRVSHRITWDHRWSHTVILQPERPPPRPPSSLNGGALARAPLHGG